jgi:2-keto-4-pentenoate hydratase/2-oxohepta-3-ene-1,7-dioic acid hydratase in catechol pathway
LAAEEVGTIRCIGVNYHDHGVVQPIPKILKTWLSINVVQAELNFAVPPVPMVFLKPDTCVLHPSAPLILPRTASLDTDFEVELGVILSKTCKNVSEEEALDYVLGYITTNDVSARGVQFQTTQFCYGKGFDGFAPMGPTIVSAKSIPNPSVLELKCTLNGKVMQESRVSSMIFPVAKLVSHLSQSTTLKAGTVIMTGTPGGIGHSRTPPVYLKEGDDLRVCISHGLGTLVNPIILEGEERRVEQ